MTARKIILCSLMAIAGATALASSPVLSPYARLAASQHSQKRMQARAADNEDGSAEEEQYYYPLLLRVSGEDAIETLESFGFVIFNHRDDIVLACVPMDELDKLTPEYGVCRAEMSPAMVPSLDIARDVTFADMVHAGTPAAEIPAFDGTGVIAAFTDTGFDPHHPAFEGRVALLTDYDASRAYHISAETDAEIAEWVTDSEDNYHATHVAGIIAGGYRGNDVYGFAPGATIVGATSGLSDVGILAGIEDIIAYAKEKKKPVAINMSISSNVGPHDGTDLMCQYLDKCAEDAVIVIASGNYGDRDIYRRHRFADKNGVPEQSILFFNSRTNYSNYNVQGIVDLWSMNDSPITARITVFDQATNKYVYTSEPVTFGAGASGEFYVEPESCPEWGEMFSGYIGIAGEVNADNGRTNVTVFYNTHTEEDSPAGKWSRYYNALIIEGVDGEEAEIFTDGWRLFFRQLLPGSLPGTSAGSLNNMSCGYNTITVGAASTRNSATLVDGTTVNYGFETGGVAPFTSYATLLDGRSMPHVCAPGNNVISAASKPYFDAHPEDKTKFTNEMTTDDGSVYRWFATNGTSMAAPCVTGIAALWLQANPNLTGNQIRLIMQQTATTDVTDIANPRWGAGLVNAYEGLKEVYSRLTSTEIVNAPVMLVKVVGNDVEIALPGDFDGALVEVYNAAGMKVASVAASGTQARVTLPSKGVYVVRVTAGASVAPLTQKVVIR